MKAIGEQVFTVLRESPSGVEPAYERVRARNVGLNERWLQDAVIARPEIVISPCRAANLAGEEVWAFWEREYSVGGIGKIDILLLSSTGRVGIVETKLSYNPQRRREVVAQLLEYAFALRELGLSDFPDFPVGISSPDADDVETHLSEGDFLLIVAGDELDESAIRLGRDIIGNHLTNPWDLAFVEVALYRNKDLISTDSLLAVPHLRGVVLHETRQVVRIILEDKRGDPTSTIEVVVEPPTNGPGEPPPDWDKERFLSALEGPRVLPAFRELAERIYSLATRYSSVRPTWGRGKHGSMILKRVGKGIVEIHVMGYVRFRPRQIRQALPPVVAERYLETLGKIFPEQMSESYPSVRSKDACRHAEELFSAIETALQEA